MVSKVRIIVKDCEERNQFFNNRRKERDMRTTRMWTKEQRRSLERDKGTSRRDKIPTCKTCGKNHTRECMKRSINYCKCGKSGHKAFACIKPMWIRVKIIRNQDTLLSIVHWKIAEEMPKKKKTRMKKQELQSQKQLQEIWYDNLQRWEV